MKAEIIFGAHDKIRETPKLDLSGLLTMYIKCSCSSLAASQL